MVDRAGHASVKKKPNETFPCPCLNPSTGTKVQLEDLVDEEPVGYVLHAKVTAFAEHSGPGVQMARNGQLVLLSPTGKTLIYRTPNYTKCKGTVTLREKTGKKKRRKTKQFQRW